MVIDLEGTSGKRTVWMIPIAAIVIWEVLNLALEHIPFVGNALLLIAPIMFFLEFAILPVLSLWLGAHAVKRNGLKTMEAFKEFAIFFCVFLISALIVTLATTSNLSRLDLLAVSLGMFAFLAIIKLALSIVGLLIGMYLPSGSSWDGFKLFGAVLSVIAVFSMLVLGAVIGQLFATSTDVQQSPGFSYSVEKCASGEWAYIKIIGLDLNITTIGKDIYRTREVCHSAGNSTYLGSSFKMDLYSIDNDSRCSVTSSTTSRGVTKTKESCKGDWPGYTGPQD